MLTVHHLNNSRSQRVLWLLEELGVPYEIVRYQRQPDMRAPNGAARHSSARQIARHHRQRQHHRGVRRDRRIHHRHLWQRPPDPAAEHAGAAALHLLAALCRRLGDVAAAAETAVHADAEARAGAAAAAGAQGLQPGADHAGQSAAQAAHGITGKASSAKANGSPATNSPRADIQMSFPLEAAAARGGLEQGHPKAMAFLERIHARPAYARALEKGGPYVIGTVTCLHGCTAAITSFTSRAEPSNIAGRIDAVAEPDHDQALRRHDHDALAEIAGRKERVARDAEPHARLWRSDARCDWSRSRRRNRYRASRRRRNPPSPRAGCVCRRPRRH